MGNVHMKTENPANAAIPSPFPSLRLSPNSPLSLIPPLPFSFLPSFLPFFLLSPIPPSHSATYSHRANNYKISELS